MFLWIFKKQRFSASSNIPKIIEWLIDWFIEVLRHSSHFSSENPENKSTSLQEDISPSMLYFYL